ncbi:MAG: M14 family metallopeptidase [Planctomycetes bacterium]|nr:M14 family metallopeptidase [Planctomycetota bacterium]
MTRWCCGLCLLIVQMAGMGCATPGPREPAYLSAADLPDQWRTRAERTQYTETGRYPEVVALCRRLAEASPFAHYTSFGSSGEGRPLPLLILSRDQAFTPQAARSTGKLLVLVQNCIHPGECAGKDASLELARDILITGVHEDLLDHVNLLIMPIFSPDGHERFGPYCRINQNGPREMGWRVTTTNLNLNRDYTKADTVEMRAWLRTWVAWQPDLLFDNHTTDGSDHRYELLYAVAQDENAAAQVAVWVKTSLLHHVLPALKADGHLVLPYGGPRDRRDLTKGISGPGDFSARFSTGYGALCNRPAILLEAHAHKPYAIRVRSTYSFMLHTLEELNQHPAALRNAISRADQRTSRTRGGEHDGQVVLSLTPTDASQRIIYHAWQQTLRHSDITGSDVLEYSRTPVDVEVDYYGDLRVAQTVAPPAAYLVPPQWNDVIDRLELHGVEFFRLARAERLAVESYRFEQVEFQPRPYEGRQMPSFETVPMQETRTFVAGTVVVPLAQARAKLAVHLLEPEAPDSLLAWGFMNAIFERKEYAEDYALEPIAQQMLARDPKLAREFAEKLASDGAFAQSAGQRLHFFYRRSPYWDTQQNSYPIARLRDAATLSRLRAAAR